MEYPTNQNAWSRAKQDTNTWFLNHIVAFFLAFLIPGVGTVLATHFIPSDASIEMSALYGFLGGVAGLILLVVAVFTWNLLRAPYKQRNEVRQRIEKIEAELKTPRLFDILCPTTSVGLPINKLDDGSYQASVVGISPKPLQILHRGELTTINRFTMTPRILFVRKDKGWETTTAITLLPRINPLASSRTRDLSWNVTNLDQWVLDGLPLTLAKDEQLTLPTIMISIKNGNEVGSRLDKGETCILAMSFGIFTDKGSPLLPDQKISLTRSDTKIVVKTWYPDNNRGSSKQ